MVLESSSEGCKTLLLGELIDSIAFHQDVAQLDHLLCYRDGSNRLALTPQSQIVIFP